MQCANLITVLLSMVLAGCGNSATVEILQTTNISSKVAAICSGARKINVTDVSGDGSVVVGICAKKEAPDDWQAFLYSQSSGVKSLGAMEKNSIDNIRISADGLVIWGTFYIKNEGSHVFRYTQSEGLQDLGTMGKKGMSVNGVSADGSVIVGDFLNSLTGYPMLYHAFRYSQSQGFEDLGAMSTESMHARGVSADGSLIVGNFEVGSSSKSTIRNISSHAFRYSRSGGMQDLGEPGWGEQDFATGISNDGAVVVGDGMFVIGFIVPFYEHSYVFIHTEKGGMQKLGGIRGDAPRVTRISVDGTKLIGSYRGSNGESYVYTAMMVLP